MNNTCYMCDLPATGKPEHVPPQCLFPEQKDLPGSNFRKNLITVPSCDTHNSKKSMDDEYLMFVLVAHFANNSVATRQFTTKILRALQKRTNLRKFYTGETKDCLLFGQKTMAFKVDKERFDRGIDHIARGLYFHEFSNIWRGRIVIRSSALLALKGDNAKTKNKTTQDIAIHARILFKDVKPKGEHPEVFQYQLHAEPDKDSLLIRMLFYEGVEILAVSYPRLKPSTNYPQNSRGHRTL